MLDGRDRAGEALPRRSSRSSAERSGSSSAPAPRRSRRCATSGWSRSGTTATTSTTSRGRRTPTPARCCSCAPRRPGARPCWPRHARSVEAEYLAPHRLGHGGGRRPATSSATGSRVGLTGDTDRDLERDPLARSARLPSEALPAARARRFRHGPVLVQTPRAGYATRLACDRCRTPAVCAVCHGPLRLRGPPRRARVRLVRHRRPRLDLPRVRRPRPARAGARRRAHGRGDRPGVPGVHVRHVVVGRAGARRRSTTSPAIVVATPGAEPVADGGYAAVLLLDTWLLLGRADLRATEEAVRRWANAAALVRPVPDGGRVLVVGDPAHPGLQALVRWDPGGLARREIDERRLGPPAARVPGGDPDRDRRAGRPRGRAAGLARRAPRCSVRSAGPRGRSTERTRRRAGALRRPGAARRRGRPCPRRWPTLQARPLGPQAAAPAGRGRPGRARVSADRR